MNIGNTMEDIRKKRNISIIQMCNALNISVSDYQKIVSGKIKPTIYQKIMFVCETEHPIE